MEGEFNPERKWPRLVPTNSVMVSIHGDAGQAYGLIANVSISGACVVSGVHFPPGRQILLRVSFDPEGEPFTMAAEVIWTRDDSDSPYKTNFLHGVRFRIVEPKQQALLDSILTRPGFEAPVIPGIGQFESLMVELTDELDLVAKKTGQHFPDLQEAKNRPKS